MLDSLALAHPFQGHKAHHHAGCIADTGPASLTSPLDRCREGWAKAISHPCEPVHRPISAEPVKRSPHSTLGE
jgi:hypothetical protein